MDAITAHLAKQISDLSLKAEAMGFKVRLTSKPCLIGKVDIHHNEVEVPDVFAFHRTIKERDECYATTLHEFGHMFGEDNGPEHHTHYIDTVTKQQMRYNPVVHRTIVRMEIGAWRWALDNALYWNADMSESAFQAIMTYDLGCECFSHERAEDTVIRILKMRKEFNGS